MLDYPADFLGNILTAFGKQGERWLSELPSLLTSAAQKWELTLGKPMLLSYNYVTSAYRADGTPVVLKIGVPNREFVSELNALEYFNGDGCVRLLETDREKYMYLMERLEPGGMLVDVEDDDLRTHIACDLMLRLWRPVPKEIPFIHLSEWFDELAKLRPMFNGGTGPFSEKLVQKVEKFIPELFSNSSPEQLIHGDFHHFNVLSSSRGWLVIDPKGVIGPPEYECGPLLINPVPGFASSPDALHQLERRIAILSERLGFSRARIRDWALCFAALSSYWDLTADGTGGEYSRKCAELIARLQI